LRPDAQGNLVLRAERYYYNNENDYGWVDMDPATGQWGVYMMTYIFYYYYYYTGTFLDSVTFTKIA